MSDLESFSPSESSEGIDAGALDRLREQMKEASAAMARDQKQEQKQKKTEDALYNVLVTFINQLGSTHPLVKEIVYALSSNVLSEIILVIISINYPTLQKIIGLELVDSSIEPELTESQVVAVPNFADEQMPLFIKLNLEKWITLINQKLSTQPQRNLQSISIIKRDNPNRVPNHHFVSLLNYISQEYLIQNKIQFNGQTVLSFIEILSASFIDNLELQIKSTQSLNSQNDSTS